MVVKRDSRRGEYMAYSLVDRNVVVPKDVDSVVATIETSVSPLTTVELLCVHPVLELTDGVMDNKARFDYAEMFAGHRALLVTPFRTACSHNSSIR